MAASDGAPVHPTPAAPRGPRALRFPEGPVAMPDGSVLVVEVEGGTLSRVPAGGGPPRWWPSCARGASAAPTARRWAPTARCTS